MWPDWNPTLFQIAASSSLRIVVVAGVVAMLLAALRVRSGGVRHAAWTAVLAAMLLMPILPRVVPAIAIPLGLPQAGDAVPWESAPDGVAPTASGRDSERFAAQAVAGTNAARARAVPPASARTLSATSDATDWRLRAVAIWPLAALGIYLTGVLFFLSRLVIGWVLLRRIVRSSHPVSADSTTTNAAISDSPGVVVPLTAGVFRPHILLPSTWRTWPDEKLHTVLAHEVAHVRRRDPLIALAACVNRAVFWFNPLGWWLERTLAKSAEDACDDAALRTVATPRRYAELLLDMAESVRSRRGRVAWQGVGVDGTGLLGQRIDRILRGEFFREVSMTRKFIVGFGCAAAIILVVACRQQPPAPRPLQPDPQVAERIAKYIAATEFDEAAKALTAQQAATLEASLQKNPEDAETRRKLQLFYQYSGQKTVGWNETLAARRRHILWLIEHHPGDDAILSWGTIYPAYDPAGYAQARELWLTQTAKKDAPPDVLSNAARFFELTDRPLAEQLLLRLETTDPDGPTPRTKGYVYRVAWSWRLGELYARAMLGISEWRLNRAPGTSPEVARSAFALEARKKLATTRDTGILRGAALALDGLGFLPNETAAQTGLDPRATAASYLERVLQLEPGNDVVRRDLESARAYQRDGAFFDRVRGVPRDKWPAIVSALPDAERIERLPWLVDGAYRHAEFQEVMKHDPAAAKAERDQARKHADDLLALCDKLPNDPHRSETFFTGHVVLAGLALRDNDTAAAVRQLDESVKVPPGEQVTHGYNSVWDSVAVGLLERGERESVARFLERVSALTEPWLRDRLTKDAAAIHAGRMPAFYQNKVTPRPWDQVNQVFR
jgi:beta-lactamase regulating signal transducer with metallopeptidase domain